MVISSCTEHTIFICLAHDPLQIDSKCMVMNDSPIYFYTKVLHMIYTKPERRQIDCFIIIDDLKTVCVTVFNIRATTGQINVGIVNYFGCILPFAHSG